jgi:hypothetical protein
MCVELRASKGNEMQMLKEHVTSWQGERNITANESIREWPLEGTEAMVSSSR